MMTPNRFLQFCFILAVFCKVETQSRKGKCFQNDGKPQRCMPEFVNAAFNKGITANNTCGTSGRQLYCAQLLQSGCKHCDASDPNLAHSSELMTDVSAGTWWQSETLLENERPVRLELNLGKTFDVAYIRIRFQRSRPRSFAIYKKLSTNPNAQWIPYQFYSGSCRKTYNRPNNGRVTRLDQKVALCTNRFSGISPLRGGIVTFSTIQSRPDVYNFDRSAELQDWVTAAAIRIDLDELNTFGDEVFRDPNVLRSYYFAISDVAVGGRCKCNGHASDCYYKQEVGSEARFVCNCKHHTAGDDCEKCKALYNDKPWARATADDAFPCARCECNNLADSCVFDPNLYRTTGRGGRCLNCRNNTDGINCERCRLHYYRSTKKVACRPCSCNPTGSRSLQCDDNGKCVCRPGVTGDKCDRCVPGYYGFSERGCRLKKLETEFYKLVTIKQASRDLHLSREAIRKLYCYWTLKRKANDNVPLIALTAEQKEQLSGKQGIIFIHEQMNMEAARFTILRQDLERLRNLCYMIVKREKARRELHRSSYEVFYKQHDILTKEDVQPEDEEWICKGNEFMHFVGFPHYTTKSEYESKLGISNADGEESKAESSNATDSSLPGETSESDRGELPTTKGLWSMSGISLPSLDINTEDNNGLHRVSFDRNGLLRSLHPDGLLTLSTTIAPPEKKKRRRRASRYAYNPPKKRKKPNPKPHSGLIPSSDVSANDSEDVTSSAISGIDTTSDVATDGESSEIKVSNEESKQDSDGSLPSDKFVDLEQVPDAMRNGVKGSDTFDREVVPGMDDSFHELTTDPGSNSIDGLKSGKVNEEQATIANGVLLSEEINDNYIQATHLNDKGDATTESASNAAKVLQDSENIPKETSETCELSKRANGPSSGDLSSVDYSTESENLDMNLPKAIESGYRKRTQSTIRPFKSHRTSNSKSPKEEKLSTQLNNYRRLSPRLNKFTSPRIPETESNQLVDKLKSGENHVITFEDFERPQRITRSRKSLLNAIEGTART